jgi:hypothetical protein
MTNTPLVSVLITTYNRSSLLQRALTRVLWQDFSDLEVVVIDDCSSDDTPEVMKQFVDPRVRYIRNEQNVGGTLGDRAHIQRFVHELARGKYHVYLCDDDYWLGKDLLSRQVKAHEEHPDTVMVVGGQLSYFLYGDEVAPHVGVENLHDFLNEDFTSINPHVIFTQKVFPKCFMTSDEYLAHFASNPAGCNIIGGGMLYNREKFIQSGALQSEVGSKWQAGYELVMGPGCYGDVVYIDEPCVVTEIRQENASFGGTQLAHYLDCVHSIELAFMTPIEQADSEQRIDFLEGIKRLTITNISRAFMNNTLQIKRVGELSLCTEENISVPVTYKNVLPVFRRNGVPIGKVDAKTMMLTALSPAMLKLWDRMRGR